jgi:hypothetical protein
MASKMEFNQNIEYGLPHNLSYFLAVVLSVDCFHHKWLNIVWSMYSYPIGAPEWNDVRFCACKDIINMTNQCN